MKEANSIAWIEQRLYSCLPIDGGIDAIENETHCSRQKEDAKGEREFAHPFRYYSLVHTYDVHDVYIYIHA